MSTCKEFRSVVILFPVVHLVSTQNFTGISLLVDELYLLKNSALLYAHPVGVELLDNKGPLGEMVIQACFYGLGPIFSTNPQFNLCVTPTRLHS